MPCRDDCPGMVGEFRWEPCRAVAGEFLSKDRESLWRDREILLWDRESRRVRRCDMLLMSLPGLKGVANDVVSHIPDPVVVLRGRNCQQGSV